MTDCPNVEMRDRLPDLLHDRLDVSTRATVVAHVGECADCRAELALLRQMRVSLSSGVIAVDTRVIARTVVARTISTSPSSAARIRWTDWRLAAAVAVILVGGGSLLRVYARRAPNADAGTRSVASSVSTPRVTTPPASAAIPAPPRVTDGLEMPKSRMELAATGDVSDLSDSELKTLLGDLDTIEAVPPTEPEPVSVRVSLPEHGGTDF
jgi:anti-sigma factor RsiW